MYWHDRKKAPIYIKLANYVILSYDGKQDEWSGDIKAYQNFPCVLTSLQIMVYGASTEKNK